MSTRQCALLGLLVSGAAVIALGLAALGPSFGPAWPTPSEGPLPGEVWRDPLGVTLVYVPAGRFVMGSTVEEAVSECQRTRSSSDCLAWRFVDETPPHPVEAGAFWLDQYEVSVAQYMACQAAGVCAPPAETDSFHREAYYGKDEFDEYPVINVDWHQAAAFCAWREARLPTEAEWEYAARGPENRLFPWGEAVPDESYANFGMMQGDTTGPQAHPQGVSWVNAYNLIGNVWEWTASPYVAYPGYEAPAFEVPPEGRFNPAAYVIRGGSWGTDRGELRASERFGHTPDIYRSSIGFRCARSEAGAMFDD